MKSWNYCPHCATQMKRGDRRGIPVIYCPECTEDLQ